MKKIFVSILILSAIVIRCKKDEKCNFNDNPIIAPQSEITSVQNYLSSNNITAIQHPSGFFYKINTQGGGQEVVNLCSNTTVTYKGRLTDGTVFDSTKTGETVTFELGQVIVGWQKGVPLISSGGNITLYIPPSLGYGPYGSGSIPGNSILIFDVGLVSVN